MQKYVPLDVLLCKSRPVSGQICLVPRTLGKHCTTLGPSERPRWNRGYQSECARPEYTKKGNAGKVDVVEPSRNIDQRCL